MCFFACRNGLLLELGETRKVGLIRNSLMYSYEVFFSQSQIDMYIMTIFQKRKKTEHQRDISYYVYIYDMYHISYIYMGSGRFPGPMELLQQLVRVSKTR